MTPYCRQDRLQARRLLVLVRRRVQRAKRIIYVLPEMEVPTRRPDVWRRVH